MRLIDADALKKDLTRFYDNEVTAKRLIDEQPTIEPQRIKGRWTEKTVSENPQACGIREWQSAKCSVCGKYHSTPYLYSFTEYAFCPVCGADMRGEQNGKNS